MAERLSREELYDLVWSKTMGSLSTRFGVSNVVLKQTCQRAAIPMPAPGHWTKKAYGKETFQATLPVRFPGMDNDVVVARLGDCFWLSKSKMKELYPPPCSVNTGLPRNVTWHGRSVTTGIFKEPVHRRISLRKLYLDGDGQADLSVHGGAYKAVYCYPLAHYDYWKRELPNRELPMGIFGENFTLDGSSEESVQSAISFPSVRRK